MPEQMIGNYKIVRKIGAGGMGDVFLGVDVMLEREVAIKSLLPELSRREDIIDRFRSEAVAMGRLNHPNIATVYNFLLHDTQYHLVMEFVRGQPLDKILEQRGAMPWNEALPLLCKVLNGLEHAHGLGIVHRDIKPANLMVTPDGSVKLMDFGIARILQHARQTRAGHMVGTLEYMSPEHIQGKDTDARTDIYSVGIVAYEMLTGCLPFRRNTDYEIIKAQVEECPRAIRAFKPDLPPVVEKAVLAALEKKADARPRSAATFRTSLEEAYRAVTSGPMPASVSVSASGQGKGRMAQSDATPPAPGEFSGATGFEVPGKGGGTLVRVLWGVLVAMILVGGGVLYRVFLMPPSQEDAITVTDAAPSATPAAEQKSLPAASLDSLSMEALAARAEAGDAAAQYEMGLHYLLGRDVRKDLRQAEVWLTKAANAGYARAAYQLGICCDMQRRFDDALAWFLKSDAEGDRRAAPEIGLEYAQKGDYKSAIPWLQKGAEANHGRAQYTLGMIAYQGLVGEKNFSSAKDAFEQAAKQNLPEAQFMLGLMAELGQGMERDLDAAQRWLKTAEKNGYGEATRELERVRQLRGNQ